MIDDLPEPSRPSLALGLDAGLVARMIALRRHLHRHPELSNAEIETQRFLKHSLAGEGITDCREVAGYGLAVDITGTAGASNRKVAIRADIDALPISEQSEVPFASENPGVMHACGHDAHAAMGFAAAVILHNSRDSFRGTARLIFQPAEEAEPLGARRVVAEGLLDDVDAAIGIHVDPYTQTGKIAVGEGPYTLACDTFDIVVSGSSAHAAKPSEGVDAIAASCSIVSELQKIVSRETDPYDPLVISITGIQGGGAYNVIAERVELKGTIRYGRSKTRDYAWLRLREILEHVAHAHRATASVAFTPGEPAVVNDPEMVRVLSQSARQTLGPDVVISAPGWTAADDFGFYSSKVPAVYFRLGVRNEQAGSVYPLHHPRFRVDEDALAVGALALAGAARHFLR